MSRSPFLFVPGHAQPAGAHGLWFAFRRRELLVREIDCALPTAPSLERAWGLSPVRTQTLGQLDDTTCFSAELPADAEAPPGAMFVDLRQLFGRLSDALMAVAGRAVQVVEWDRTHQFCGACAQPTLPHAKARARVCPACRLEAYPRIAPAMIVLVERGDQLLLARSPHFPPGIYGALAGFVDAGESVEDAVHREVYEETGIRVQNVRYFGSQPWPFPNSLMLAFQADYEGGELRLDPDEIEDAQFFRADALPRTFPGRVSIGQWLLHDFLQRHGLPPPAAR
jgi:NAD+ diphosphatase